MLSDNVKVVKQLMNGMNAEELHAVSDHLRACNQARRGNVMLELKATLVEGDKVSFVGRYGRLIEGKILKFNRTTVSVDAGVHGRWRVAASLLTKVTA